ncbi:MAG TPA: AI-2E family transporter [Stellaceae bacterium]|nr:AI-2E family transporter [Stellaceae bacterium]
MTAEPLFGSRIASVLRRIAIGAVLGVLVWALADVLLLVFAAIIVAVALRGSAVWVSGKTGLPVGWSLTLVIIGAFVVAAASGWWGGTSFAEQAGQLREQLTAQATAIGRELERSGWTGWLLSGLNQNELMSGVRTLARGFAGIALTTLTVIGSIVLVLATGIYLAIQPELYRHGFLALLPIPYRRRGGEVLNALEYTLRWWLIGRIVDMVAVVVLTLLGLYLLGMPLAFVLAVIAGLLNYVPYIGAIAGAVPAVLVAFGQGPTQALWVALLFVAIQTVEGYLLAPQIQQQTVSLPPAVTIVSLTVFGALFGLLGLLLAPALAAVLIVVVRMVYVEDVLGDRESAEP